MPVLNRIFTRFLPVAAIGAGLLLAAPAADAAHKAKKKDPIATIALGDKRPGAVKARLSKVKAKTTVAPAPCANTDVAPTADNLPVVAAAVLCLHNQVRAQAGLPALKANVKLQKSALGQSADMVNEGFFDHTNPAGDTFVDRIIDAGYVKKNDGWTLGENLAWGTGDLSTPAGVMNAWMNSAGHKANILKRAYKEVGHRHPPRRPERPDRRRHLHHRLRREALVLDSASMADVEPLQALHYDLQKVGGLQPVAAPPYDVIDAAQRQELLGRSPYNVVEVDLPQNGGDPYAHAAEILKQWSKDGIVVRDETPALWALAQDYTGPGRADPHAPRRLRARQGRGLRPRPDPPARAHAPGSEGGPAAAHPRHAGEPLADLQPLRRSVQRGLERRRAVHRRRPLGRGDRRRGHRPQALAGGRSGRHRRLQAGAGRHRAADRRRPSPLRDRPRLPAGGAAGRPRPDVPGRAPGRRPDRLPHAPPRDRRRQGQAQRSHNARLDARAARHDQHRVLRRW